MNEEQNPDLFVSEQHEISRRNVVVEDDGTVGWLYLTEPDGLDFASVVWVYNRIRAPVGVDKEKYYESPPPCCQGFAGPEAMMDTPREEDVQFEWGDDGNAVALFIQGRLMAVAVAGSKYGYSRNVIKDGPWGSPLDKRIYRRLIGKSAES